LPGASIIGLPDAAGVVAAGTAEGLLPGHAAVGIQFENPKRVAQVAGKDIPALRRLLYGRSSVATRAPVGLGPGYLSTGVQLQCCEIITAPGVEGPPTQVQLTLIEVEDRAEVYRTVGAGSRGGNVVGCLQPATKRRPASAPAKSDPLQVLFIGKPSSPDVPLYSLHRTAQR
jgi:hypothetical protein